jgi:hypothetical protein
MVMTAPPQAKAMFRPRLRKHKNPGGPPAPPSEQPGFDTGPRKCDQCHIADAVYEVIVAAAQPLYFCGHHARKHWTEFIARGYKIRKL